MSGTQLATIVDDERGLRVAFMNQEEEVFQLEFPKPTAMTNKFTVFWKGNADVDRLSTFVEASMKAGKDLLGSLLFFPTARIAFPPRHVYHVPSPLEKAAMEQYGLRPDGRPSFLRYEV